MSNFEAGPPPDPSFSANTLPGGAQMPPSAAAVYSGPTPDERTMAMLAELLQLFSSFIGPLVIFLVKRDSPFVRFHALQAILWHIVMGMVWIAGIVVFVAVAIASSRFGADNHSPVPMLFIFGIWALFGGMGLLNLIVAIYYAIKANNGIWASYPVIGRIARSFLGLT